MGRGDFSNPDGCGRGEGQVKLRITYTPFDKFERHPADSVAVRPEPTRQQRALLHTDVVAPLAQVNSYCCRVSIGVGGSPTVATTSKSMHVPKQEHGHKKIPPVASRRAD